MGGAKMRDPAREEQRGFHYIAGTEAAGAEEVARMIQGHECHDEAAQDVYGNDPCRSGGARGNTSCRRNWRGFNPLRGPFQMHCCHYGVSFRAFLLTAGD